MQQFEYKVVPAPERADKVKGAKTPEERFAQTVAEILNSLGKDGWEYQRTDTLPSSERSGLTRRATVYRSLLIFRRVKAADAGEAERKIETRATAGKTPTIRASKAEPEAAPPVPAPSVGVKTGTKADAE
ncbi:MAG: DUF4177 domain-containing protein [Rhodobacteraceae bacterium]|nr:DUF4177 domain-containing protein [Paracoccaceae bacterium]